MSRIYLLITLLIFAACSSNEENSNTPELLQKPMQSFISKDSIHLLSTAINEPEYEFGTRMKFKKDGSINGIGVQMPDSGYYRITIWNLADTSIVLTDSILVDSGEVRYKDITSIPVEMNDEIRITVHSNDWYLYVSTDNSGSTIFPDTVGDIILIDYSNIDDTNQTYPTSNSVNYYAGFADIIFKAGN